MRALWTHRGGRTVAPRPEGPHADERGPSRRADAAAFLRLQLSRDRRHPRDRGEDGEVAPVRGAAAAARAASGPGVSMDPSRHLPLMFAVLDGEATPEEVREVEQLIADDAGARAEYEAQRRFFAQLKRASQLDPPSGLADAAANRFQTSRPQAKEKPMSRKISKRALWIGTAVAAAAVVIAAFVFNFPPRGEN